MKEEAYIDLVLADCNPTDRQPEPSISGELLVGAPVRSGAASAVAAACDEEGSTRRKKVRVEKIQRMR